jgi:uncharacterized membrane protein YgcG
MTRHAKAIRTAVVALGLAGLFAVPADGEMVSTRIDKHLCKTVGGGKFVDIPAFPGEKIDRRLLPDVRWMRRNYKIFITDAYALSGHAANGEHPIGLAADIIPDRANGGTWRLIGDLAHRFEPQQDQVRPPMRWVGYNGDAGHGRGDHLHLSWLHSKRAHPGHPVRKVYTRICPDKPSGGGGGGGGASGGGGGGGGSGGVDPTKRSYTGLSAEQLDNLAPPVPELGE